MVYKTTGEVSPNESVEEKMQSINKLDERDRSILDQRIAMLNSVAGPRVGDFVLFADNVVRRISYVWDFEPKGIQTSDSGSFYLGDGYVSFSGGLYGSVSADTLTLTDDVRLGSVWFFHNNFAAAHGGIDAMIPFRVYRCSCCAPR